MIERHIAFDVKPGKAGDFERFFVEDYRPPVLSFRGLIECSLLREADSETRFEMVFRWETGDDAVAWRVSDAHQALQPALQQLHDGMVVTAFTKVA